MALQSFRSWQDIIIKPADKGGAVVVSDRDLYISETHCQLDDNSSYQTLTVPSLPWLHTPFLLASHPFFVDFTLIPSWLDTPSLVTSHSFLVDFTLLPSWRQTLSFFTSHSFLVDFTPFPFWLHIPCFLTSHPFLVDFTLLPFWLHTRSLLASHPADCTLLPC